MKSIVEYIKFKIYCINDFHGVIESLIWSDKSTAMNDKWLRLFSLLKDEKSKNQNVLLFSAGDMFISNQETGDFKGLTSLLMKEAGFNGMTIGNHELETKAMGEKFFSDISLDIQCPFICCNIFHKDTEKIPIGVDKSKIIDISGIKIGVVGVATTQYRVICTKEEMGDYEVADEKDNLKREIMHLKNSGADYIILLAHMDINYVEGELQGELAQLLNDFASGDINLVLAGHSHTYINDTLNGIPVMEAGAYGEALSYIEVVFDVNTKKSCIYKREILEIGEMTSNTEMSIHIKNIALSYLEENSKDKKVIGCIPEGEDRESDINVRWMEYVTDTIRIYANAHVGIINRFFFRQDITDEIIYDKDILDNMPFRNSVFTMIVKGDMLMEIFEEYGDEMARNGAVFSGIKVSEIEWDKEYILATTDFMAEGGDLFVLLKKGSNRVNHKVDIQDIVMEKLKGNLI